MLHRPCVPVISVHLVSVTAAVFSQCEKHNQPVTISAFSSYSAEQPTRPNQCADCGLYKQPVTAKSGLKASGSASKVVHNSSASLFQMVRRLFTGIQSGLKLESFESPFVGINEKGSVHI